MIPFARIAFVAAVVALSSLAADAQTKKTPAKSTAKSTVKSAAPVAAAAAVLPAAGADQMSAYKVAHLGSYDCEFGKKIVVEPASTEGYLSMRYEGQQWTMKPELSSTGALNMNDVKGKMRYLQIANKSMLMDTSAGRRVVDGCQHATQKAFEAANK
jgi:membrane protein implicated in regulation of membrane protease activity